MEMTPCTPILHITIKLDAISLYRYKQSCLDLQERIEGCTVESLSKTPDHKNNHIPQMPGMHHYVCLIFTVHHNPKAMLVVTEKLHLINPNG